VETGQICISTAANGRKSSHVIAGSAARDRPAIGAANRDGASQLAGKSIERENGRLVLKDR
jgi:hypothetical protein